MSLRYEEFSIWSMYWWKTINLFDGLIMLRICLFYILKFGGLGSSTKSTTIPLTFHQQTWEINQDLVYWRMLAFMRLRVQVLQHFFLREALNTSELWCMLRYFPLMWGAHLRFSSGGWVSLPACLWDVRETHPLPRGGRHSLHLMYATLGGCQICLL